MRGMTASEIDKTVISRMCATICTVTHKGKPYAIEATLFFDGETICFMINPRRSTERNIQKNTDVLLKFTQTKPDLSK